MSEYDKFPTWTWKVMRIYPKPEIFVVKKIDQWATHTETSRYTTNAN